VILRNKQQKLRFGFVGVINTIVDFGLLFTLRYLGLPSVTANFVSTSVAFTLSFGLNKNVVFRAKGSDIRREVTLFIITTLFGLWVLQTIVITVVDLVAPTSSISLFVSKVLATIVTICWNYVMYSRVVFKKR
jgi:putative flippase GtrA